MNRLLFITNYFLPEPGSLEAVNTQIARSFERACIETVVTTRSRDNLATPEESGLFDEGEHYPIHRIHPKSNTFLLPRNRNELLRYIRERISLFAPHHLLFGHLSREIRLLLDHANSMRLPYSIFLNGTDSGLRTGRLHPLNTGILREAESVYALNPRIRDRALDLGVRSQNIELLPPFLPDSLCDSLSNSRHDSHPATNASSRHAFYPHLHGKTIFLGLGPLLSRKGFDLALEALRSLKDRAHNLHLILAGSGPEFTYLEEIRRIHGLENTVTMTGFLSRNEILQLFNIADAFILPGRERNDDLGGSGISLMEAAYRGIPVIAGSCDNAATIVQNHQTGYIFPEEDIEFLASAMLSMREEPEKRKAMGSLARKWGRTKFDSSLICKPFCKRIQIGSARIPSFKKSV